ncbi:MAG: M81 family metallopeptidase [Alphaproteobacteria bacterium]|jgi:microcystin degradation protein MlrC|nr:M81 family metallopeptidase [Alphaproteobacteria bacterium]MDP6517198.1 M81 family metallopeptidase [Alphaproteobacteria bacterium]
MRIAVGGFHHETNTFAPEVARFEDFVQADGWPALTRGEALFDAIEGLNLPVAGFVAAARAAGHRLAPLAWCSAPPSAHVTEDAFERVSEILFDQLAAAGPVDAVYLDLHGATVTEHCQDGEGELLSRVRAAIGADVPLVASLDLHANVTRRMVAAADGLIAYRTYPHVDMARSGRRAASFADRLLSGARPAKAFAKLDYLIPLVWQCSLIAPCKDLYDRLEDLESADPGLWSLSFTPGFPPADIAEVGPAVLAYGDDAQAAEGAVAALADAVRGAESAFAGRIYTPEEAVAHGLSGAARPLVIADTQDNPGAGGNSDTLGLLRALIAAQAPSAVLGLIYDPETAEQAHGAGQGAEIAARLGARSGWRGEQPFVARFRVQALGQGRFTAAGPMFAGARMELGPMAALRLGGVEVAVASKKMQAADRAMFRHVGIEPAARDIIVLKSSVHFRADFTDLAGAIIVAAAPGPNAVDHMTLPYRNLPAGLRRVPRGPAEAPGSAAAP